VYRMVLRHALMRVAQYVDLLGLRVAMVKVAVTPATAVLACIVMRVRVSAVPMES
jgi:hypothetical protein